MIDKKTTITITGEGQGTIAPGSEIHTNVTVKAGHKLTIAEGVIVHGTIYVEPGATVNTSNDSDYNFVHVTGDNLVEASA